MRVCVVASSHRPQTRHLRCPSRDDDEKYKAMMTCECTPVELVQQVRALEMSLYIYIFFLRRCEDRNTWEPWDNLLEEWVQDRARDVREQARAAS